MNKKVHSARMIEESWHAWSVEDTLKELSAVPEGLEQEEAGRRLALYGPNALPKKESASLWEIILHQILNPLIFILLAAALASVLIGEVTDALFILAVIALNSALGTYQEFQAEKSASSLQKMLKIKARVRRDGRETEIDSESVVPGDIVLLESGNKVPADLRLIRVNNLHADESFLTGESIAAEKKTDILPEDTGVSERTNIAFAGSTITSGRGVGVVIGTATQTQVGQIAQSVAESESAKPPLVLRMEKFTKNIGFIILGISAVLAALLYFQGHDTAGIFFFVVALAVSAIPEGLPVALTVALSIATKRMSRRNVVVRKLTAVESLGSCTVIASDKTGTLTVNQQTARQIVLPDGVLCHVSGEGYNGEGEITQNHSLPEENVMRQIRRLSELSVMANEAALEKANGEWTHHGDAMDVAFLALGYKAGMHPAEIKKQMRILADIPYESEHKFSAAFYEKEGNITVAAKGAVETILDFCGTMRLGEKTDSLDRVQIESQAEKMAQNGLRVLAVAGKRIEKFEPQNGNLTDYLAGMEFQGLVGFIDPLRPEAVEAVKTCKQAGLKVIMITGDHPQTAGAIARELGLTDDPSAVVTGQRLSEAGSPDSPAFMEAVGSSRVFARVTPQQKLEIVDVLIRQGEFVAVTGDGVNDTPALRRANIGVAMGSGTDAAKEVGSMIIVDDNFSSIVAGVEEGRFAYDNVRKVIYLLISTGAAEVILFVAAILAELPLPLLAVQLLWLNLVTNGIQDVALAFEGGEPGAMKRKPRKTNEKIFNPLMIQQTVISGLVMGSVTFALWFWLVRVLHWEETVSRNMILLLMVFLQNIHVMNCRSERTSAFRVPIRRNIILVFGVIIAQGIHLLSMQIPFMQNILRIEPVSPENWFILLALAVPILIGMEIFKIIYSVFQKKRLNENRDESGI